MKAARLARRIIKDRNWTIRRMRGEYRDMLLLLQEEMRRLKDEIRFLQRREMHPLEVDRIHSRMVCPVPDSHPKALLVTKHGIVLINDPESGYVEFASRPSYLHFAGENIRPAEDVVVKRVRAKRYHFAIEGLTIPVYAERNPR